MLILMADNGSEIDNEGRPDPRIGYRDREILETDLDIYIRIAEQTGFKIEIKARAGQLPVDSWFQSDGRWMPNDRAVGDDCVQIFYSPLSKKPFKVFEQAIKKAFEPKPATSPRI